MKNENKKILIVDITEPKTLMFFLVGKKEQKTVYCGERLNLLVCLDEWIKKNKLGWPNLAGIALLEGGGTFSNVRLAATILNTIHLITGVSVAGIDKRKYGDWQEIITVVKKIFDKKTGYIKPIYSGEPNITL